MSEGGTKAGSMVFEMDLDRTKLEKGLQDELSATKKTVDSMESAWRALGTKSDEYFASTRTKAIQGYEYIAKAGTASAEQIARAAYLGAAKIDAINQKQFGSYVSYYQGLIAQAEASNVARNNANAQYWISKIAQDKAMLNAEIAAYEENAMRKKVIQDKLNADNAQWWMQRITQAKVMGRLEVEAYEENALRKKAIQDKQNLENSDWWMNRINRNRAMLHTESEAWAENAARNKTIQNKAAQDALVPWQTLNIRSTTAIKNQMELTTAAATQLQAQHVKGSQDWLNIEKAKNEQLKHLNKEMVLGHEMSMAAMTRMLLRFYAAYYVATSAIQVILAPLKTAMQYLSVIETSSLGIAASFMTSGKFVDKFTGKIIEGQEALREARGLSMSIIKDLEYANLQTIATLDELIIAYQTALPVALARGFNVKQVKEFTVAMVQAAGAIGLPMNQMAEEIRSLLTGAITPRNTRIATVLGLRNEDINEYKNNAQGLFDFLIKKLSAYQVAGIEAQNTWNGLWSNTKDIVNQLLGNTFEPLFIMIKYEMQGILDSVVTFDKITKTIKWNQGFLDTVKDIKEGIHTALAELYRIGMLLDIGGAALNRFKMALYSLGNLAGYGPSVARFEEAADAYLNYDKRFLASDKALMDMAMREHNFVPATADTKNAEKIITDLGQILYYRKELQKLGSDYSPNKGDTSGFFETLGIKSTEAIEAQKSAIIFAYEAIKNSGTSTAQDIINAEREKNEKIKKLDEEMLGIKQSNTKHLSRDQESATKSAIEATRKASYEINSIGMSQYQKDIDRIEAEAEKYRKLGVSKINIANYVEAETALAKRKSFAVDAENTRKMYEEMKKGKEEYQSLLIDLQSATLNAHDKAMQQISKAEDEVYKKIEKLLDEAKISWEQAQELFNLVPAKTARSTSEETVRDTKDYADFYSTIEGYEQQAYDKKIELIELERQARIDAAKGAADIIAAINKKAQQEQLAAYSSRIDADHKMAKTAISSANDILDNALTCYAEDSYEYKRIQDLKKVMLIAEMAMEAIKNAQLLTFMIAQNAAYAAAMVKKAAGLQLTAAEVILTQGTGDPYTAFARMAAAAAIVASVLGIVGLAFGGGSGGESSVASPALPTSTVLGAADGTGSESIQKSWELMQDTYDMQFHELRGIYNEMKNLNNNITGLVTSIIRTGGISQFAATSSSLGGAESLINKLSSSGILSLFMGGSNAEGSFFETINKVRAIGLDFGSLIVEKYVPKFLGSLISGIFGGGSESSLFASGISLGGETVGNLASGGSILSKAYNTIHTHEDGGWFSSDSDYYDTYYQSLDADTNELFTKVFQNLSSTIVSLSQGLGTDVNAAMNYVFSGATISFLGMDSEKISSTLAEYFSGIGDTAISSLFGHIIRQYQQVGEGMMETASRLIIDKAVVLDILETTNQAYVGTTSQAIAFSETLINLAGDLDTLRESASIYYDKFFTDAEKQADLYSNLSIAMADMNLALPDSREAYRAIVEGLDLTTSSGQSAYVSLMAMAEGADTYYTTLEDVAEDAANATADLVNELKSLSTTIAEWLASLGISKLNPVLSEESYRNQYTALLSAAQSPTASADAITDYLNYATTFLTYQKSFGTSGSYQAIYDAVVADVMAIQAINTAALASYASGTSYVPETGLYQLHQGEIVSRKSDSVSRLGQEIGKYIIESNGGSNGGDIHVSVQIDGKEIGNVVAKQTKTNSDLQKSIRSLN